MLQVLGLWVSLPDTNKFHQAKETNVASLTMARFDGIKRSLDILRVGQFVEVGELHIQYPRVDQGCFGHSGFKIRSIPKTDGLSWDSSEYSCLLYAWLLQGGPLNPIFGLAVVLVLFLVVGSLQGTSNLVNIPCN